MADTTASPPASPAAPAASPAADVLNLRAPALSATSDIPVLTPAPAPSDSTAAAPPPAGDDAAAAAATAAGEGEGDGGDSKGKDNTPAWQKAEITKERNRRRAAEAKAEAAEAARADADRRLEEALKAIPKPKDETATPPPPPEAPRPKRPTRAQFDDPDAFDAALSEHEDALIEWSSRTAAATAAASAAAAAADAAKKAADDAAAATAEEARKTAEEAQVKAMQTKWEANRTKAIEQLPDYAEVAENPEVQISLAMASVITTRPDGPQIAYHLGKNPELSARIAALTPPEAVFELGLIAAQLQTAKPPELTKAPDPVRTVGARAAATRKGPEEESMEEYAARRQKEVRAPAH